MDTSSERPQRPRRRRFFISALVTLLLTAVGALAWWWATQTPTRQGSGTPLTGPRGAPATAAGTAGPRAAGFAGRTQPVSAGTLERRAINIVQPALGTIAALNTVVVRPRVDGELKAIHFSEGQTVRAGQLLAEIDPRAFEAQLAQAEGQLARDQAQLANARNDLARYQDLVSRDAIARQQLDTQAALVKQLSGSIRVAEAAVANARLMLSYTRITAPISGQAGLRLADPGNIVRAGDTGGLVVLTQTQPISVVFAVPESVLPQIRARMKRQDPPKVEAWDREQRQRLAAGEIVSIDNAIDVATGTLRIKAQFDNRDGALFPNQFVNIRLFLNTLEQALAAPANAIQRGASGTFVYLISGQGSVALRPVEVGVRDGDWVSIRAEGLQPGDKVVTDGADRLRPGARVEVIVPRTPAANRPGNGPPAAPVPTGGTAAPSPFASSAERPPWLDRLPPAVQERFMAMTPEERAAFIQRMQARRQSQPSP
jgi:multidrug efflux system membrane fusion protein